MEKGCGVKVRDTALLLERLRGTGAVERVVVPPRINGEEGPSGGAGDETYAATGSLALLGPVPLPMAVGDRRVQAQWYVAAPEDSVLPSADRAGHLSVIAFGDLKASTSSPLVRMHSACFTGDVLGSMRCDCGPQLQAALEDILAAPAGGMVVYLAGHEGRGIGLWAKAAAYLLQDDGLDTYGANEALGFGADTRDFRQAAAIIRHLLGERPFRLLTNNPSKVAQLHALGLTQATRKSHVAGVCERNRRYLQAKINFGHAIPAAALAPNATDDR